MNASARLADLQRLGASLTEQPPNRGPATYISRTMSAYPAELEEHVRLADGLEVFLRPIRPEDGELLRDLVANSQIAYVAVSNSFGAILAIIAIVK